MAFETILLDIADGMATLKFNRPKVLNALNRATMEELSAVIDELGNDGNVRCIILTGAGEKAFVGGADINELRAIASAAHGADFAARGQSILFKIEFVAELPKTITGKIRRRELRDRDRSRA